MALPMSFFFVISFLLNAIKNVCHFNQLSSSFQFNLNNLAIQKSPNLIVLFGATVCRLTILSTAIQPVIQFLSNFSPQKPCLFFQCANLRKFSTSLEFLDSFYRLLPIFCQLVKRPDLKSYFFSKEIIFNNTSCHKYLNKFKQQCFIL